MRCYLLIIIICISLPCHASISGCSKTDSIAGIVDSAKIHRHRSTTLAIAAGAAYAGTMIGLYNLWYCGYPQSNFHFFNDNNEWMGMDKLGHATTSYYVGRFGYHTFRWAGMSEQRATWIGGSSGFIFLTIVEILDGFSSEWGASPGDLAANTLGSALFISQQMIWHDQKVLLKWSYHPTSFPGYRPDLYGSRFAQKMVKDYNGHTYWLSANLCSFIGKDSQIPRWLNVAVGFGANGMTGAANNSISYKGLPIPEFKRQHILFIAPDIDFTRIHTRSVMLKWVFEAIGFLKFPLPAIEFRGNRIKFHPLYF